MTPRSRGPSEQPSSPRHWSRRSEPKEANLLANYGYKDGSGEYFITIDTERCDGCGRCVAACPYGVLEVVPSDLDPLADTLVAAVTEEERKKIKYTCAPCKPVTGERNLPCVLACEPGAITHSW